MKKKILGIQICAIFISAIANAQVVATPVKKINVLQQNNAIIAKGADLTLQITSIDHNAGNYTINYTLKNVGTENIDLKEVSMQGNIYKADGSLVSAGGGMVLLYEGVLNAGKELKGKMGYSTNKLYSSESYIYRLKADDHNKVAETNENNNVSELAIVGYATHTIDINQMHRERNLKKGMANEYNDATISIRNIEKRNGGYFIDYTIKNVGTSTLDFNNLSTQCYVQLASDPTNNLSPAGGSMLGVNGTLAPGQEFQGSRHISYSLQAGLSYRFFIDVKLKVAETNLSDNRASRNLYNIQ